jgi:hypothetical protein
VASRPGPNGPVACAGGSTSIKKLISNHLADAHNVWLTTGEYRRATVQSVADLDPCKVVLVA